MKIVFALFAMMLFGCASFREGAIGHNSGREDVLPRDYFSAQQRCFSAWETVVEEWIGATGGMHHTIEDTKRAMENDRKSRLSALFRGVWAAQKRAGVEAQERRGAADLVFLQQIRGDVPVECSSTAWLTPLLAQTPGIFQDGARESLLSEAPPDARVDGYTFSQWLMYSLLAPPKQ